MSSNDTTSLKEIFDHVLSTAEINNAAGSYFLQNSLLFRKWVALCNDFVGDAFITLVVSAKFCPLVSKVAHNESGHFSVRKTYFNILSLFFLAMRKTRCSSIHKNRVIMCQLTGNLNQCIKPAPLQPIPVVSKPFEHLIVNFKAWL